MASLSIGLDLHSIIGNQSAPSLVFSRAGATLSIQRFVRSVMLAFQLPPFAKCAKDGAPEIKFWQGKVQAHERVGHPPPTRTSFDAGRIGVVASLPRPRSSHKGIRCNTSFLVKGISRASCPHHSQPLAMLIRSHLRAVARHLLRLSRMHVRPSCVRSAWHGQATSDSAGDCQSLTQFISTTSAVQ